MPEPQARLAAMIPATVHNELRQLAEKNDRSISAEVRRALIVYLNRERGRA